MAVHFTRSSFEGFKTCSICCAFDRSDDDPLWNDSEYVGKGSSKREDCKDGHYGQ